MKKLFSIALVIAFSALIAGRAYADGSGYGQSNCQTVYGGGDSCNAQVKFAINKMVQKPTKGGEYVENLTVNDAKYAPKSNVNFKVIIENTGDRDIQNLNVVDNFPQFLTFVAGVGNSNAGAKQINFVVGSLKKGQKVEYVITAKTANDSDLSQAVTCVTNNIKATSSTGAQAEDNSQVCIQKGTPAPTTEIMQKPTVTKVPATGPETDILFGLIPTGALGFYLKRKA